MSYSMHARIASHPSVNFPAFLEQRRQKPHQQEQHVYHSKHDHLLPLPQLNSLDKKSRKD